MPKKPKQPKIDIFKVMAVLQEKFPDLPNDFYLHMLMHDQCPEGHMVVRGEHGYSWERIPPPKTEVCKVCKQPKSKEEMDGNIIEDMCDDCFRAGIQYATSQGPYSRWMRWR